MTVLQSVKKEAVLFLEEAKLAGQKKDASSLTVAEQIKDITTSLEKLRRGWMGLYDRYADGEMDRETFINQKREYNQETEKLETRLSVLQDKAKQSVESADGKQQAVEAVLAYQECSELTEGMKENLIDKVFVYEGGRIEVVWNYGDCLDVYGA